MAESAQTVSPQFVMATADKDAGRVREVKRVAGLEPLLVEYIDHEGKTKVQVVFRIPGLSQFFILREKITGLNVCSNPSDWFTKSLGDHLENVGIVQFEEGVEIDEEGVAQV